MDDRPHPTDPHRRTLDRRFLLDLTHAPAHEVMNVFTAWQRVAATIERQQSTSNHVPPQAQDPNAD
jgi:hypothetical protein